MRVGRGAPVELEMNVTKCVFVKGPDRHWSHEAGTSKEVNVRDQQDALY